MFLKVKGIGKIQDSSIELNGITVIAGENNTGKSTFGKVLYCIFYTLHNADDKVFNARANEIKRIFQAGLPRFRNYYLDKKIIDDLLSGNDIREVVNNVVKLNPSAKLELDDNIINILIENLQRSIDIDKHEIQKMIVTHCFEWEFSGKINHVNNPDISGTVYLEIKKKEIEITIKSDVCTFLEDKIGLLHNAIYIDTPLILDEIKNFYGPNIASFYNIANHRDDLMNCLFEKQSNSSVLEEVITKQKLNNLLYAIGSIVGGEFKEEDNSLLFAEQGLKKPIHLSSVSTGSKVFLILKRLLEIGKIKERDILIFDEPEIHLHPEWQIKFAEILILLQKEFNLTILLTTHSPYFLHAVEIFSKKYDIQKNCKFYLAKSNSDVSDVDDVSDKIDEVYKQMAMPFQKLEDELYDD